MNLTDYTRVENAIKFLENNFRKQPELAEIAEHVHLSPFHFERLFKRWAGVTPKRFLQFLTLNYARQALQHSDTVLGTAFDAGLSSGSRLHDLFVNIIGMTPGEYKQGGSGVNICYGFHNTRFGSCFLAMTDRGICAMSFWGEGDGRSAVEELRSEWPNAAFEEDPAKTRPFIERIMHPEGNPEAPISLHVRGTNFQLQVWQALLKVPPGIFVSYEDLARFMGRPDATRAVSSAVAKNPVGYLIPCHRVIRKSGHFGKYHWGSARKKAMIGWEKANEFRTSNSEFRVSNSESLETRKSNFETQKASPSVK